MKSKKTGKNTSEKISNLSKNIVKDYNITNDNINDIIHSMDLSGGFESRNLSNGINIINKMKNDKDSTNFISFVGALVSTGCRGIIKDMIKKRYFDCIITTCGAVDHDIAKAFDNYYAGEFNMDDYVLQKKNIHRLGNILIPMKNYGPLIEEKVQNFLSEFYKLNKRKEFAVYEFLDFVGSKLNETSILYWAHKNKIPVIVPGIVDGAVGNQIWLFSQQHQDTRIDILKDQTKISDIIFESKKTGALMLGGGISKHHTMWWNQFRGGLDYAVYFTTASEWDGSLSGALVREAVSWNKINKNASQVTIHGEITSLLPFVYAATLTNATK